MSHARKAARRFGAVLLSLSLVLPSAAQVVVRPGPVAVGPAAAAAAAPVAPLVPAWTAAFQSFLTGSAPDPSGVRAVARDLARLDLNDPVVRAQLAPLAAALSRHARPLLVTPGKRTTNAQLEDADTKLEILNYPAVRALLPEDQQGKVGAAAWAYHKNLWEPSADEWIRKKRALSETLREIAAALERPAADLADTPAPAPGPGPQVSIEVLTGDIAQVRADAVLTTVQDKHLCRGGVNAVVGAANPCFFAQLQKAPELADGESLLARGDGKGPIESVVFVKDRHEKPLSDIVYEGLRRADREGLKSVAVPAMRTGSVFGAVERSYREIALELRKGVERFASEARASLESVSFVVHNDAKLAEGLQNAFGERVERERSLRTDLREAKLSANAYELTPRPRPVEDRRSPIYGSLLEPWDLKHLLVPHRPVKIGEIEGKAEFSRPVTSVLNMPVKLIGGKVRVPVELEQFREFLQKVVDHEKAVNPDFDDFYMYLTVDQHAVKKGLTHRRPGVHIDGVQGARYKTKLPPEHLYSASDALGTVFYDQSFDLTALDPAKHHVHAELERQADEGKARATPDYDIAFWDSYSVHRADLAKEDLTRTFVRVEFSRKKYDSEGDTVNPALDYHWERVARPIPADLDDKPVAAELGPLVEPGAARARLRRLKAYARGLLNQFWWNVGPPVREVWRAYRGRLELARAEGRRPAVRDERGFFRGLRLLGTAGKVAASAGFVVSDEAVLAEARVLFAAHFDADAPARGAFERYLRRAAGYNPGKRRTKTRSTVVFHMREASERPKEELAAFFDGQLRDEAALTAARADKDAVMADFKKTVDRLVVRANATAAPGKRVLGALVFGSFANGAVRPGSDIDLQFVTEDGDAPDADLPAQLEREWAKLRPIKLEIISFTYVPPDPVLLARIHPEPILVVTPYADVQRRLSRAVALPMPPAAASVSPSGRLVRALFDLWLRVLLGYEAATAPRAPPERIGYDAELEPLEPGVAHTIKDVRRYVLDNLGRDALEAVSDPRVGFLVVEGDGGEARRGLEAAGWTLGEPTEKAEGFHQVLRATTPDGEPAIVVLRVNGAERMVHLRSFLKLAGVPAERVRSRPGFRSWKKEYRAAFRAEGGAPDSVVYGMTDSALAALRRLDPEATFRERTIGKAGQDVAGLPMTAATLSDGRRVWLFRPLYGRLAGDLMEALLEHGARRVVAFGAAGALGPGSRVGDWYTPAVLAGADGRRLELSFIKEIPGVPRAGVQLHVDSPNGGTRAWLERTAASGVGFVESELRSIVAAFAGRRGAELSVAQGVTEVMTGPNRVDLTETTMDDSANEAKVADMLSAALGPARGRRAFETGYDPALDGVEPGVAHTIKDLRRFVSESVPPGVLEAKARPGVHFYIVEGDGAEARRELEKRGWTLGAPMPRKEGFRQFYPATTPGGEPAVVALHVNGRDRVIHVQSYLKLAGIEAGRVHTLRGYRSRRGEYAAAFRELGYVPDGVVYGLPWTVIHRLLARDASTDYEALRGFRRGFNPAPDGIPADDLAFRPMKVLTLADGRRYWFFMHLYGDQVGDLMAALREHGVRAVTVLGSAGATNPDRRVGDWVTPALPGLTGVSAVPARAAYRHVSSPAVETARWLKQAGPDELVEVELKHVLHEAAKAPGMAVSAAYIVSDVLSGPHHTDLTETVIEDVPGMAETVDRIVGETLGLEGPVSVRSVENVRVKARRP